MSEPQDEKKLSKIIAEAVLAREQLRADGASAADIDQGFERIVRAVWPFTREWHYLCDLCDDTGLRMFECTAAHRCDGISTRTDGPHDTPGKYKRLCTMGDPNYTHTWGEPCHCPKGARFLPPRRSSDDFTKATKQKPPSRFGR